MYIMAINDFQKCKKNPNVSKTHTALYIIKHSIKHLTE